LSNNVLDLDVAAHIPKARPSIRIAVPMAMRTTGGTMWFQRVSAFAMTGRVAKYHPATHGIATQVRNTAPNTDIPATVETAKIGT